MFVRVKSKSKDKYNKSVQLVESKRVDGKVKQSIVKHIGVARLHHFFSTNALTKGFVNFRGHYFWYDLSYFKAIAFQ